MPRPYLYIGAAMVFGDPVHVFAEELIVAEARLDVVLVVAELVLEARLKQGSSSSSSYKKMTNKFSPGESVRTWTP